MEYKGFCVNCKQQVNIKDPTSTKLRNKKSKSGHVESMKGKCHLCEGPVYTIIGHG
jgi:hypothetical protein